jgi:multidrug efflux system outer membrane protein
MKPVGIIWSMAILAAAMLSGCSLKSARYQPPLAPAMSDAKDWNTHLAGGETSKAVDDVALSHWWSVFGDPELTSLEERALKANLDLRKAEAEIRQARANRDYYKSNLFPNVSGTLTGGGSRTVSGTSSFGGSTSASSAGISGGSNSLEFQASWEPDIFGAIRKNVASYGATLQSQEENLRNVMVTLTGEVALNYIDVRSYQAQLAVTKSTLVTYRDTYDMTVEKRDSGLSTDLDVQQALETVQSTEADIPTLETSLRKSLDAISVLLARRPGAVDAELSEVKPIITIPPEIAVGIPGDLIRRRPDVRVAERQYAAQWMQVGVAKANMYPTLTLGGAFTTSANAFLNVFTPGATAISSVTGSLQQTLLNRRALKAQLRLQNALLDQGEVAYESTVLGAIQDVEDALKAFEAEQARQKALTGAADSAKNAAEMSRSLYSSGLKDFLTVLDSERTELSARNRLVQSDATVAENLVRLYKAMGGGWQ